MHQDVTKLKKHFTEEQEAYLTDPEQLVRWASRSIEERVRIFKGRYPDTKANTYRIRKLYR